MFDKIYKIANESNSFDELKGALENLPIDAQVQKNGFNITAGFQLATEGKDDKVEWLRQLGADVDSIALGYAKSGNHEKVEFYRTQYGADVSSIAFAYAKSGNHEKVEFYRMQYGADVSAIAFAYAESGNHEKVEFYRTQHGADVSAIAFAYAEIGNHDKKKKYDINYLLQCYLKERTGVTDTSGVTKEYFYGSFFSSFQKNFTQKRNAINALDQALKGYAVDLNEHLSILRNGTLGKELRAFIKSGMANDLVGKNVTTVSEFVQALYDRNSNYIQLI